MKRFPLFCLLAMLVSSCSSIETDISIEETKYYALFMQNYHGVNVDLPSGNTAKTDNLLYEKKEIVLGETIDAPEINPERNGYSFQGWYKEAKCLNIWDFANETASSSVILYAKWNSTSGGDDIIEPEYTYPETIITDDNYRLKGILNTPINGNNVGLTLGAIRRLEAKKDDISFALNYERKADVNVTSATYDPDEMKINVSVSSGESFEIQVTDITPTLSIANENAGFETKANKYEEAGREYTNYHIMLAGSSSMEYWTSSALDMSPIISYNHGIGGTKVQQWTNKLAQRLIFPYSPKAVAYYVGVNNIINSTDNGTTTGQYLIDLFNKTHEYLPNSQVFYVLINKLPGYLQYQNEFDIANKAALDFEKENEWLTCIDAGKGLLKENGNPHYAYFRPDGLHMSHYGYVLWGKAVKEAIVDWLNK